ncbi:transcriptional regulator, SARP family [Alloactinosynnema sp. L-07]|uniref:NB-ARC domain-containing protein n=1 Tax=Alloactinosynnema sp. L-07 TaxID=1653480 RepID=UPI00065F0725|nr:NB-ARC domain-containing protein [Alloactinosynnema sp. L-07]CRK57277.1 transcriptional regulator, SARP family [Alloactinosynnema sp. L-07]
MTTMAAPQNAVSFGALLRALRAAAALSQEQLALCSGVSVRTIRDLERGRVSCPHGESVRLLADALTLTGTERAGFEVLARRVHPDAPRRPTPRTPVHDTVVPAQLPMDIPVFAARLAELAQLDDMLGRAADQPTAVAIAVLTGAAGVGKTALAVRWAHRVRSQFPGGQLYVDLRGSTAQALRGVLGALGATEVPETLDARVSLYRSLLAGRRTLIVLDDACDVDQVRPLLPGASGSVVVVTSRDPLADLVVAEGAHPVAVDRLSRAESHAVLVRRLGAERVQAEPRAVETIISACAGVPMALAALSARAAIHRLSLSTVADELVGAR